MGLYFCLELCLLNPLVPAPVGPLRGLVSREAGQGRAYGLVTTVIGCHGSYMVRKLLIASAQMQCWYHNKSTKGLKVWVIESTSKGPLFVNPKVM